MQRQGQKEEEGEWERQKGGVMGPNEETRKLPENPDAPPELTPAQITSPARQPGESYEEYKVRRRVMQKAQKQMARGRVIWDSKQKGPARVREHASPEKIQQMMRDAEDERRIRALMGG